MGAGAGFHADLTTRLDALYHFLDSVYPVQLLAPGRLFEAIDAMHLEDILCQIDPNANKLHTGLLL
jgi:hypothetical protein